MEVYNPFKWGKKDLKKYMKNQFVSRAKLAVQYFKSLCTASRRYAIFKSKTKFIALIDRFLGWEKKALQQFHEKESYRRKN